MTRVGAFVVALLLVLAGCSGLVPGSEGDGTSRSPYTVDEEVQPTGDTTTESETDPDYLVPGLTADGVENASTLLEHHFGTLEGENGNATYAFDHRSNRTENGTLTREIRTRYVTQAPERWWQVSNTTTYGDNGTETGVEEAWVEDHVAMSRFDPPDEPVDYSVRTVRDRPDHPPRLEDQLEAMLRIARAENANVTVEERPQNGTTWYVVTATLESNDDSVVETTTFHVREDGFIEREYREAIIERTDSGPRVYKSVLEFENLPDETLERPDWYEEAFEATEEDDE